MDRTEGGAGSLPKRRVRIRCRGCDTLLADCQPRGPKAWTDDEASVVSAALDAIGPLRNSTERRQLTRSTSTTSTSRIGESGIVSAASRDTSRPLKFCCTNASTSWMMARAALIRNLEGAAARERGATVQLIALLAEMDVRRLFLEQGYSSLFVYCTKCLHLSEHAAYSRIEAARAARKFPIVLERGDLLL